MAEDQFETTKISDLGRLIDVNQIQDTDLMVISREGQETFATEYSVLEAKIQLAVYLSNNDDVPDNVTLGKPNDIYITDHGKFFKKDVNDGATWGDYGYRLPELTPDEGLTSDGSYDTEDFRVYIEDLGVTTEKINNDAVTNQKIADNAVQEENINFGLGANQVSAEDVPIEDIGGFFADDNVEDAIQDLADDLTNHNHDDRYFTEAELSISGGGGAVHWDNVTNKPVVYPPSAHTHDADEINVEDLGGYYTATDVEGVLQEIGSSGGVPHNHDDRYYTEIELDSGQLDNRYFTEIELSGDGLASVHWNNLTNVPATFPPSSHTHDADEINIADSGGYYSSTEVENALQEIGAKVYNRNFTYKLSDITPSRGILFYLRYFDPLSGYNHTIEAKYQGELFDVTIPATTSVHVVSGDGIIDQRDDLRAIGFVVTQAPGNTPTMDLGLDHSDYYQAFFTGVATTFNNKGEAQLGVGKRYWGNAALVPAQAEFRIAFSAPITTEMKLRVFMFVIRHTINLVSTP